MVPGIRAAHLKRLFGDGGWRVLEAKYGCRLQTLFAQPDGDLLRTRIDEMSNEEYQALIRLPGAELRPRLTNGDKRLARLLDQVPDAELPATLANLGGHDVTELLKTFAAADAEPTSANYHLCVHHQRLGTSHCRSSVQPLNAP